MSATGAAGQAWVEGERPEPPTWDGPTAEELAALDALEGEGQWSLDGHDLKLTNLDKVLFPGREGDEPLTKRDLIRHYAQVAPVMLPYLHGRAMNSNRFPRGVDQPGFWHKAVPSHAPDWITRWDHPGADADDTRTYIVVDRPATLAWLANYGAVELNPWNSRSETWSTPAWAFIDLDPGERTTFEEIVTLARLHKAALDQMGVQAAAKVTGKRGIQIWVPVIEGTTFDEARDWVEVVSRAVGRVVPELVSWAWAKKERKGLARLDFTQNAINKTLVAPWSVRPAPGAPVSVPIAWDELDDEDLAPDRWTIRTVMDRIAEAGDPMAHLIDLPQHLPEL